MKKIVTFTTVFTCCYLFTTAQIKKDAMLLGGQVSVYSAKNANNTNPPDTKYNNSLLSLNIGTAFKQNNIIGIYGAYGQGKSVNQYSSTSTYALKQSNYRAGIFYRKYKSLLKNFYFFGEANAGYTGGKQTATYPVAVNNTTQTYSGAELGLTPGFSYQVCKKMQLEILMPSFVGLQYATTKNTTQQNTIKGNSFSFNTSLNSGLFNGLAAGFKFIL